MIRYGLFILLLFGLTRLSAQEMREVDGRMMMIVNDSTAYWFDTKEAVDPSLFSVVSVIIEPLEDAVDPVTEGDLIRIAQRRLQLANEASELAAARALAAVENKENIEQRLFTARSAGDEQNAGQLQRQLLLAERVADESAEEQLDALRKANLAAAVVAEGQHVQAYNINRRRRRARRSRRPTDLNALPHARRLYNVESSDFSGYGPSRQDRPSPPCQLAYEGEDETNGDRVRLTASELFFSHTDESLRPYLEGREYLQCQAHIYQRRGYHYLQLEITFANPNALTTYGYLPANSALSLHLLDGNFVSLRAAQDANGSWDAQRGLLSYQVSYPLDRSVLGLIRSSELDFLRLYWSSGFEEYDIYQVDLLQRLLNCLRVK